MDGSADLVTTQVTISAVVVFLLERLKRARWFPWLSAEKEKVTQWVAAALAALAALGIHTEFDATKGVLIISGLTVAGVLHGGFEVLRSLAFQELIYHGVVKKPAGELIVGVKEERV